VVEGRYKCNKSVDYLPDLSGRWKGIMISKVGIAVSSLVAISFDKYLQEKAEEVQALLFSIEVSLISTCR
jgi:hypothetical protein